MMCGECYCILCGEALEEGTKNLGNTIYRKICAIYLGEQRLKVILFIFTELAVSMLTNIITASRCYRDQISVVLWTASFMAARRHSAASCLAE